MDLKSLVKRFGSFENIEKLYFLVQFDRGPHICVRKIIQYRNFLSNEAINEPPKEPHKYFMINDNGLEYLAVVLFCSEDEDEGWDVNLRLQYKCMESLFAPLHGLNSLLKNLQPKVNIWFLVLYNTPTTSFNRKEAVFKIFPNHDVTMKGDDLSKLAYAFVEDQEIKYESFVLKIDCNLDVLLDCLNSIRNVRGDEMRSIKTAMVKYSSSYIEELTRSSKKENYNFLTKHFRLFENRVTATSERSEYTEHLVKKPKTA